MENSPDICSTDGEEDARKAMASTSSTPFDGSGYRLFGREASVHNCIGGGKGEKTVLYLIFLLLFRHFFFPH